MVVLVTSGDGQQWVVKHVPGSHPSMLPAEAEGLQALGASAAVAVPSVHYADCRSLVMEALGTTLEDSTAFWQRLGEDIAALQESTRADQHGWSHDNWLGGLPQRNTWDADGHRFFAEHRVLRYLEEPKVRQTPEPGPLLPSGVHDDAATFVVTRSEGGDRLAEHMTGLPRRWHFVTGR